ncbi:MAG: thiamine pyrophosphate-binding protein [Rubrimonas sp.]|uniref:thiamine pyrophosphate-binding protein n=1 Tax=Rubrimonas sp. TaxID=2036015 RepID=UPI002FDEB2A6
MPRAVDLVAARLAAAGCRFAFGLPGGEVLAMLDALDRAGIAFRLARHETAAGFMAEGAWHATGAPGVLLATLGPGLANAVNAAANALQDQVPLLILSGCVEAAEAERYTHQVIDQTALMRPVCKASFRLTDGAVDLIADKAVRLALGDPQGPVHIDIPVGLATRDQPPPRRALLAPTAPAAPAPGPQLEAARAALARAERPVMLAGVGAVAHRAGPLAREVCARFGMPLLTTYKAKGLIDEADPLCLGGHGLSPKSDAIVRHLLDRADLVLTLGYDPVEMRAGWIDPWSPERCVALDHAPARHGVHGASVSFVGDVAAGLRALSDGVAPARPTWPCGAPAAARAALDAAFAPPAEWGPHAAFAAARAALPPETVATVDSGAHRILFSQMWRCPAPRRLLQSSGFCTMGAALPLAIGHAAAAPDVPVLAVMGDGGAEMVLGEFASLRDLGAPVIALVLADRSLALIALKQRASGHPDRGVSFGGTDWPALARAIGGEGTWVRSAAALTEAIGAARARRDRFTLLACEIDGAQYEGAF